MIKRKDWAGVENYSQKLKNEGHSEDRVNSMLTRAMYGIRFWPIKYQLIGFKEKN